MEKLRLIELCSGIGAQVKGIENAGLFEVESVATADLDKEVVVSYAAIHCGLTNELIESYDSYPSKEKMARELTEKRLGYDFKNDKPYDWSRIAKRKDKTKGIEKYWLADKISKNLGDMLKIDELPDCDFLSYSTPCQSLSISGKQAGLKWTCQDCKTEYDPADKSVDERYTCPNCGSHNIKSTRSGLLYEVERLLVKAKENGNLPKYLLMENVDALVSKKFVGSFNDWIERLNNLGYNSYYQVINAKDAGIPQNRKRIFVLSILQGIDTGKFEFPKPFDNGIRLKDVLEEQVDEKYYLSDASMSKFWENFKIINEKVTTRNSEIASCLRATYYKNGTRNIEENILNGNGYEGIVEPIANNNVIQIGNIANEKVECIGNEPDEENLSSAYELNGYPIYPDKEGNVQAIVAMRGRYVENPSNDPSVSSTKQNLEVNENNATNCLTSVQKDNLLLSGNVGIPLIRVRKLTPKECHRLMGFDDADWDRCKAVGTSDCQGYHQTGNSIVTNVISLITEHLYKALYDGSYECLDEKYENFTNPQTM